MVKSVLGVKHQGLRDWIIQRISAIVMGIYFIGLIAYFLLHGEWTYSEWHNFFSQTWLKVATILVLIGMLYHAWIGIWTIFTDYVKPYVLRAFLNCLVILTLAACLIWGIMILWSV